LYTKTTAGVFPFDGVIDAGDLAGAAFQTSGKLNHHLSFFVKGIKVCRAGINAESFFAGVTDFLIKSDMGLFVIPKSIKSQFFGDFHSIPLPFLSFPYKWEFSLCITKMNGILLSHE
jgi:hypothetical protein